MTTKRVNLPANFSVQAEKDVQSALGYMLFSALGTPLSTIVAVADRIITNKDSKVALFCMAAAVQIRGNVTFISPAKLEITIKYPELIISSTRSTGDDYNFSAVHSVGHLLLSCEGSTDSAAFLAKAGDCIFGQTFPDNAAGKINKEIRSSWGEAELTNAKDFKDSLEAEDKKFLSTVMSVAKASAVTFGKALSKKE